MEFNTISVHAEGPIAGIRLNRPDKLNAISSDMVTELHRAMNDAEADPHVRVITLTGSGRAFCSGFDLGEVDNAADPDSTRRVLEADFALIMRFWNSPKPTIAAVHGYVLGGGFELAMACDMTIAAEGALFGEPEPKFGSGIVAMLLPWITGPKQAKEMLLFGNDRVSARQAYEMGLVNAIVTPQALTRELHAAAGRCAMLDAEAVRLTKLAINRSYSRMGLEDALRQALDIDAIIETTATEESRTFKAILAKDGVKAAVAWREARIFK
ncbi:MAG TPA: enoyl-CoA hydratase/isomerase family protein [Steroidobacteraceae bacterium]|nr:enoyl-CoA hydratase/isomerase family protein [Steroidobacteraceae bacterium]